VSSRGGGTNEVAQPQQLGEQQLQGAVVGHGVLLVLEWCLL
jgi:hypothetical protein